MGSKRMACSAESHSIEILNFCTGEEVPHSVVVLEGKVESGGNSCQTKEVTVDRFRSTWCSPTTTTHSISASFQFKIILRLEQGVNTFSLKYCSVEKELSLVFRPRSTTFCVLPIYVICKGHDGRFQAPDYEDNSIDSACDRIDVGIRLVQSLFAEKLKEGGYGRYTFQLQSDINPKVPDVNVFYSNLSVEDAHSKTTRDLWSSLAKEIMTSPLGKENHKFVAFLSSTIYKGQPVADSLLSHREIVKCTDGYVALGGGGLALLGTGCLHTWAATIDEVEARLTNNAKVDRTMFMDDSNYRGTYGGCYASTLGATCHEMGHIFSLGHTAHGIMGREYHFIHQMFLVDGNESAHRSNHPRKKALPKEHPCNNPQNETDFICERDQSSPKDSQQAKLVKELKVAWSVSEHKSPLRPKVLGLRSLSNDKATEHNLNSMPLESLAPKKETDFVWEGPQPTFDCQDEAPFWPQSCLALLAYNKWINPRVFEENISSGVICDASRCLSSIYGLRVVEMRAENAKSILHWRFTGSSGTQKFHIPRHFIFPNIRSLFTIDSVGNSLKLNVEPSMLSET